ncbi:MAG TPA: short chain dehydrogenase [Polyangiaceae bacterium]|nr:short chain dehydrogenase [Polyangiaceae bacterium]
MRIIVIGGAGAVGRAAVSALAGRHEVIIASRRSGSARVDIRSADSIRALYEEVGRFDAVVCAAGDAHLGPFDTMSEAELAVGIQSKLLGQIRLVLLGRSLISDGGSFTLISGYIFDDPIRGSSSYAAANGGVEGFVRAAALDLGRGVRINAVSPGMAEATAEQFGRFNPGRLPVSMRTIGAAFARSVEGWRTGEIIHAW